MSAAYPGKIENWLGNSILSFRFSAEDVSLQTQIYGAYVKVKILLEWEFLRHLETKNCIFANMWTFEIVSLNWGVLFTKIPRFDLGAFSQISEFNWNKKMQEILKQIVLSAELIKFREPSKKLRVSRGLFFSQVLLRSWKFHVQLLDLPCIS